ncbi:MAG: ATP-dependent zinc metalloprotease FtsH [Pirellulales bacterium]|nr:ATP-dependent zinc metalloprotease FtsH [Pirellulales bacterium]
MNDEQSPKKTPPPERKPLSTGMNVAWYLLIFAVGALFLYGLADTGGRVKLKIVDLQRLIEQGPEGAIDVREKVAGKETEVFYSHLDDLKFGPQQITGTVTREVISPADKREKVKPKVPFHTPRWGLENDKNELFNLAKAKGFTNIDAEEAPSGLRSMGLMFAMMVLIMVVFFFMMRRLGGAGSAMAFGRSRGKLYAQEDLGISFGDVAGIDEAVDELREVVDFLRSPEKYQVLGGRIPKGVLLVGPPGTGKTLLAKAVAGEADVPFFSISGSDFVEMFVGVGAARVRDMFQQAQTKAPCIVFIDELDALGKTRGSGMVGGHDEREQTLNALLVEMDGFVSNSGVIVMAATNRPETLDPALLRPGRFDRHVLIDRPDVCGREEILKVHVDKVTLDESIDLKEIARITPGFVGADLASLVNEAALLAAREGKSAVTMIEFNEGVERVVAGLEKRQRVIHPDEKQRIAYHESGHALVAYSLPNSDPVHKVSIIPRGPTALGYTMSRPEGDRYINTQAELESRIQSLLAGTMAEEMIFGDVATGAQNDLERATEIARSMVMDYGMSRLGKVNFRENRRSVFLAGGEDFPRERTHSEQTCREIDEEISRIIDESLESVRGILRDRREALVALAERLIEKEVIGADELKEVIDANLPGARIVPGTADAAGRRAAEDKPASDVNKAAESG